MVFVGTVFFMFFFGKSPSSLVGGMRELATDHIKRTTINTGEIAIDMLTLNGDFQECSYSYFTYYVRKRF